MSLAEPRIIQQGNNYHVQHGTDQGLFVEFHMHAELDQKRTEEEGRPIHVDKEYVTIITPGDSKNKRVRPVKLNWDGNTPPDNERWPRQWQAFKNQQTFVADGTKLEEWTLVTKADVLNLKYLNIYTVEQLAELGDNSLTWFGARKMRELAQTWLAQAKDNSGISKLQAENDQLKLEMEAMKNQLASLLENKPEPKKMGRPKRENVNG
jgi:hypothetical protein